MSSARRGPTQEEKSDPIPLLNLLVAGLDVKDAIEVADNQSLINKLSDLDPSCVAELLDDLLELSYINMEQAYLEYARDTRAANHLPSPCPEDQARLFDAKNKKAGLEQAAQELYGSGWEKVLKTIGGL